MMPMRMIICEAHEFSRIDFFSNHGPEVNGYKQYLSIPYTQVELSPSRHWWLRWRKWDYRVGSKNSALSFAFIRSPTGTPTIYFLFFLSFLSFRFSFGVRLAFFCCSFFPLSFFPVSPITCSPCHLDIRLPIAIAIALHRNFPLQMPIVVQSFHKYTSEGRIRPSKRVT